MAEKGGYDMGQKELLAQALRSRIATLKSLPELDDVQRHDLKLLTEMLQSVEERGPEWLEATSPRMH
jgi:hypothetical protein